jgi:hypothetical protein
MDMREVNRTVLRSLHIWSGGVLLLGVLVACANPAPPARDAGPAVESVATETVRRCEKPRPEACTMQYDPVCGFLANGLRREYSNGCSACADPAVTGYIADVCPGGER